jgi:hypothetical protein
MWTQYALGGYSDAIFQRVIVLLGSSPERFMTDISKQYQNKGHFIEPGLSIHITSKINKRGQQERNHVPHL